MYSIFTILIAALLFTSYGYQSDGTKRNQKQEAGMKEVNVIGTDPKALIGEASDIAITEKGNVLVVDKLEGCIKEFDRNGKLLNKFELQADGSGNFKNPARIGCSRDFIAVSENISSLINIFSIDFKFIRTIYAQGIVFDICFDHDGFLWVGAFTGKKGKTLFKHDVEGKLIKTISLKHSSGDNFDDIFSLTITQNGLIIVAYVVLNAFEIWKTTGEFLSKFKNPLMKDRAEYTSMKLDLFSNQKVPEGTITASICTDGNKFLYILGGTYSGNPMRDIFQFDLSGNYLKKFNSQNKLTKILLDKSGYLFTIEKNRTLIKQYSVI
ncbi:MAG: hypothetical protein QME58_09030 [Bacteroidota bacterium]|nr:hypothetical protein [Bacteroidota bacterium]